MNLKYELTHILLIKSNSLSSHHSTLEKTKQLSQETNQQTWSHGHKVLSNSAAWPQ